jgi:glycine cleavage system aminomethyltransferase T/glycine/D-amino acid oxidase-like deaminating enzyme
LFAHAYVRERTSETTKPSPTPFGADEYTAFGLDQGVVVVHRAGVVVIGGGITGTSVAYHLAKAGWRDVTLIEKGELTSGSTCQAAGLVTAFNPSPTMMAFRRYSIELYRELGVFETVGSLRMASSEAALAELRRGISRARAIGLDAELLSPQETIARMPAATASSLFGAVWMPGDGYLDPHGATYAVANAARALGVTILTATRVTGIELGPRRDVRAVITERGRIETEQVVNAAGIWAAQVAAMVGAFVPSTPVDHQHIALRAVAGHELPRDMPCFRDTENLIYGKAESGGVLFGGYEPNPAVRWVDGVPWDHAARSLPPDEERFAQLMDGAIRRFPFLRHAGVAQLVCHPDAMTPDANPLLGPMPDLHGFWMAAGLSLNGFGGAGGIGRALAQWMTDGDTEVDVTGYRPWRFGGVYRNPSYAAEAARETYRYYYRLRYPYDADEWGRPQRLSALHATSHALGGVFAAKNGWERVDYYQPGMRARRAGADQREYGFTRPPFLDRVADEHRAIRERVGIIDMTSFGKIAVTGRDALRLLDRVCANRIDRPVGSVVYTQMLTGRGGIVSDVTVTRLDQQAFRVVTGAGGVDADIGWLQMHAEGDVTISDQTQAFAVIGLWGPQARVVLQETTDDDVSGSAFAFRTARPITVGPAGVLAQRITYVGELGAELYVEPRWAVAVWDQLWRAGRRHGITAVGYRALDGLRIEKGYRYLGSDLTVNDTPDEAGLGFCVALDKGEFIGADAVRDGRSRPLLRRIRTLLVGGGDYVPLYGGEAVLAADGGVVGRVRSAAYGFTVAANVAFAYLPAGVERGASLSVDVFGDAVNATVSDDVLYDPDNTRPGS